MKRSFQILLVVLALLGLLVMAGCGGGAAEPAAEEPAEEAAAPAEAEEDMEEPAAADEEPMIVGLSFSDFATERWKTEEIQMRGLLEDAGFEVITQEANHDPKLQNDQIDNMIAQGAKAIIVIAEDGDAAATAVDAAAEAGVGIISYDRLIKSANAAAYISFDNVEVGRNQADGVMKALDIENWDVEANGPARIIMQGGNPTDNNAHLVRRGQYEIVQPYIDEGKVVIVGGDDIWVENWDPAKAMTQMENILTAIDNGVDGVVASNDGTALGALQAMSAQGLAGKVPISGQDATADACNSIVKGEQTVTVFKDTRNLAPLAVELAIKLAKGEDIPELVDFSMADLTGDDSWGDAVMPCLFLPVVQVTADNVYEEVVVSGFQAYEDVYRDIPEEDRPPKP
jgi:D-xylose transport system substrate-binding protein